MVEEIVTKAIHVAVSVIEPNTLIVTSPPIGGMGSDSMVMDDMWGAIFGFQLTIPKDTTPQALRVGYIILFAVLRILNNATKLFH